MNEDNKKIYLAIMELTLKLLKTLPPSIRRDITEAAKKAVKALESEEDIPPEPEENKYPEPGKCPVCNRLGRLEYDGKAIMEGEHIYYNFTCPDCGATGKEWYEITFDSIVADQKDDSHVQ